MNFSLIALHIDLKESNTTFAWAETWLSCTTLKPYRRVLRWHEEFLLHSLAELKPLS
jgi:hypothetical protein